MKRRLLTLLLVLVLGVQGPLTAYASAAVNGSSAGCGLATGTSESAAGAHAHSTANSCCPGDSLATNCCFTVCLTSAGATESPLSFRWHGESLPPLLPDTPAFTSRGDAPRIRPPIP